MKVLSMQLLNQLQKCSLKGNYHEKFVLQNIFGFRIYITHICIKLSTETVII